MSDLKKFEQKHKEKIALNITTHISAWLDGFANTMGMNKKSSSKKAEKIRITLLLVNYKARVIIVKNSSTKIEDKFLLLHN